MGFFTRLFGGVEYEPAVRRVRSASEDAEKDALLKKAKGAAAGEYSDPTGDIYLKLTPEGHVDATGHLARAGEIPPEKKEGTVTTEHFARTAKGKTQDPTGGSVLNLTSEGHVSADDFYHPDAETTAVLDQFRLAQANERMNGKPSEQQTEPVTAEAILKAREPKPVL